MKILFAFIILLLSVISNSFAKEMTVFLKGNRGEVIGEVKYKDNDSGVGMSIKSSPGRLLNLVGTDSREVENTTTNKYSKEQLFTYQISNLSNGETIQVRIIYSEERKAYTIPQIIVNPQSESPQLPKIEDAPKVNLFVEVSTINKADNLFKDLPKSFQNLISYPEPARNKGLEFFNQSSSIVLENIWNRKRQWDSFQKRVNDRYGQSYLGREGQIKKEIENQINKLEVFDELVDKIQLGGEFERMTGDVPLLGDYKIPVINIVYNAENSKEIKEEVSKFNTQLFKNIMKPKFDSSFLKKEISFNGRDKIDINALKLYKIIHDQKYFLPSKNDRYYELNFAQHLIEVHQDKKSLWNQELLDNFINASEAVVNNDVDKFVTVVNVFSQTVDFQKGLAASLVNNLNPVSIFYPVDPNCKSVGCEAGSLFGDAAALAISVMEISKGIALTLGGTGGTFISVVATPSTGGASLLATPATVSTAIAGLALTAHGASTAFNSFRGMYEKISNFENLDTLRKSNFFIDELKSIGINTGQKIKNFVSTSKGKILSEINKTGKYFSDDGFKFFKNTEKIANEFPQNKTFAKVMERSYAEKFKLGKGTLSGIRKDASTGVTINEAFITAADDLSDLKDPESFSKKLSLFSDSEGTNLVQLDSNYVVVEFKFNDSFYNGIRSPVETHPSRAKGFIPGGQTAGGAREWLIDSDAAMKGHINLDSILIKELQ